MSENNIHWVLLELIKSLVLAAIFFSVLIRRSSFSRSLHIKTASSAYKINIELTEFMRLVVTNVALCYVAMKSNGQKNDVRCEYTRGAPEPLLPLIPIHI